MSRRPAVIIGLMVGLGVWAADPFPRPEPPVLEEPLMTAYDEAQLDRMMMEDDRATASRRAPSIGIWAIHPRRAGFSADLAFGRRIYDEARPGTVLFEGDIPRFVVVRIDSNAVHVMNVDDRGLHTVLKPWSNNGVTRIGRLKVSALVHRRSGDSCAMLDWQGRTWIVGKGTVIPGAAAPDTAPTFVVAGIDGGRVMMHEIATGRFVTVPLGGSTRR